MNKQKLKQKGILAGIMFTAILTGVGGCGRKQEEAPPKQEETAVKEPIQPELPEKTVTEEKKEPENQHTMFYGLYIPGKGFHLCDEKKCAEYFPSIYCGRCSDYGIVEVEYEDGIAIQFHRTQTFALDEDMYVFGPVFFYSVDDDDDYMCLFEEDIKVMEQMVEENLHNYMSYEVSLPVLRIGKTSEILPYFGKQ